VLSLLSWVLRDVLHASGPDSAGQFWHPGEHGWSTILLQAGVRTALGLGWLTGWQAAVGATPGMKVLRLRVLAPSGQGNPSVPEAALRSLWIQLAAFCAMISVDPGIYAVVQNGNLPVLAALLTVVIWLAIGIAISKSPTRQGIHDQFAGGTSVVRRVPQSPETE
jgi:uncharacterized RDD family membrane protein YckC